MGKFKQGDKLGLDVKTLKIVKSILEENPELKDLFEASETPMEARMKLREWVMKYLYKNPHTKNYYLQKAIGHSALKRISFRDYAAIRLMDYLDNEGREFVDPNRSNKETFSQPIKNLWLAINQGKGSANEDFFYDMLYLFRQVNGKLSRKTPNIKLIQKWMGNHPSGLDEDMVSLRQANKERILRKMVKRISSGKLKSQRFQFEPGLTAKEKFKKALGWWEDYRFHLVFAFRDPEVINDMLDHSLREDTLKTLKKARKKGIPIFVNPYYNPHL